MSPGWTVYVDVRDSAAGAGAAAALVSTAGAVACCVRVE
jgi:hypothetical protein